MKSIEMEPFVFLVFLHTSVELHCCKVFLAWWSKCANKDTVNVIRRGRPVLSLRGGPVGSRQVSQLENIEFTFASVSVTSAGPKGSSYLTLFLKYLHQVFTFEICCQVHEYRITRDLILYWKIFSFNLEFHGWTRKPNRVSSGDPSLICECRSRTEPLEYAFIYFYYKLFNQLIHFTGTRQPPCIIAGEAIDT